MAAIPVLCFSKTQLTALPPIGLYKQIMHALIMHAVRYSTSLCVSHRHFVLVKSISFLAKAVKLSGSDMWKRHIQVGTYIHNLFSLVMMIT